MYGTRRICGVLLCGGIVALAGTPAAAQDDTEPRVPMVIRSIQDGAGGEAQIQVIAGDQAVFSTNLNVALPAGMTAMPFGNDPLAMLGSPSIHEALALVEDQQRQLRELQQDYARRIAEQVQSLVRDGTPQDRRGMAEMVRQLRDEQRAAAEEVLLPHQLERLRQLSLQAELRSRGDLAGLLSQRLLEVLEITSEQQERLKQRSEEIRQELEREIQQLQRRAREKLFAELTPDQRRKLNELLGDEADPAVFHRRVNVEQVLPAPVRRDDR